MAQTGTDLAFNLDKEPESYEKISANIDYDNLRDLLAIFGFERCFRNALRQRLSHRRKSRRHLPI